jgi:zinc transporter ZupT
MLVLRGSAMEKWMCWGAAGVAGLLLVLFLADFALKLAGVETYLPFGGVSYFVDVVCALAAGILLYLSLDAMRELK